MKEEFNLSNKRIKRNFSETYMYDEKNVKEFIRLLKKEYFEKSSYLTITQLEFNKIIDKLAGKKLI